MHHLFPPLISCYAEDLQQSVRAGTTSVTGKNDKLFRRHASALFSLNRWAKSPAAYFHLAKL